MTKRDYQRQRQRLISELEKRDLPYIRMVFKTEYRPRYWEPQLAAMRTTLERMTNER